MSSSKKKSSSKPDPVDASKGANISTIPVPDQKAVELNEFEESMVSLAISFAAAFSLPKSVGAIYGLAYASVEPLSLDDFTERLKIAIGSTSQGLRFLQRMGALKPVRRPGDRRTLYVPEESMRRVILGILTENFIPKLTETTENFPGLRAALDEVTDPAEREILEKRMDNLEAWVSKSGNVLPWLSKLLAAPLGKRS